MDILVFKGTLVHYRKFHMAKDKETKSEYIDKNLMIGSRMTVEEKVIGVQNGKIIFLESPEMEEELRASFHFNKDEMQVLDEREFFCPGFIDTHVHASQYCNCGLALDLPLLDWLRKYTIPTEAKYKDLEFAKDVYSACLDRSLRNGTTTAQYFCTIHRESSNVLVDLAIDKGQRVFVGKVATDQNSADYYIEETKTSIEETEKFVQDILSKQNPLVNPVVTPRFAPSCSMELLTNLGRIAKTYDVSIQTHCSETLPECQWVKELFPGFEDYIDVYDKAGLLTAKTTLAHGIYLSEREMSRITETQTKVSHCPNSNCSLMSGLCDVRKLESLGVVVGLGTDVSGGYSISMLDAMRCSITVSNIIASAKDGGYVPFNYQDALRLATISGAEVLGISDKVGNFEVGKDFDALRVNLSPKAGNIDIFGYETMEELVQKFIFLGDDRNIREVYVAGRRVIKKF
ncbi:guanine deaminase-like isoform X2 [Artemia franciscana]|uniref:guanine deaminase-like isoform X2 n=1 Tax=Artemia franciscana TaxID=6661 RepID=UPI0032DAF534